MHSCTLNYECWSVCTRSLVKDRLGRTSRVVNREKRAINYGQEKDSAWARWVGRDEKMQDVIWISESTFWLNICSCKFYWVSSNYGESLDVMLHRRLAYIRYCKWLTHCRFLRVEVWRSTCLEISVRSLRLIWSAFYFLLVLINTIY